MTIHIIYLRQNDIALLYNRAYRSLLNLLEAHHITVEYHCRAGYCGVCRLRLLSGKVRYHQEPLAVINHGEILPCYCLPINDIELDL